MAGEYVRWLARDVKPQEKRELTPAEKRRNWWTYNKWYVIAAVVVLIFAADLVYDMLHAAENRPDYTVAYVGSTPLNPETVAALETRLTELGEEVSGNGVVEAELLEYVLARDLLQGMAVDMQLTTSIEKVENMIYLLEDPEFFQEAYPILEQWQLCADSPALAGLELPEGLYIARRGLWNAESDRWIEGSLRLWEILTDGI